MKYIEKICPVCAKLFSVPTCHESRYITCSYICGGIYRRKPIIKNICECCKLEFISKKTPTKKQRFCSTKCGNSVHKNGWFDKCINCGKQIWITPHNKKQCCSRNCRNEFEKKRTEKISAFHSYRKRAWRHFTKKCQDCGNEDERILVIHHIDGDRKNGKIENLIPVCHNCHCLRHIEMNGNHKLPPLYRGKD
ncbi:MAG: HNH endonuclease [Patescibacteria group bacterium]|nr:HNH endonuclease [Patescibacteria group bacterium]MDE2438750.1 HNH endonuclease [Patescibacteria group bacterium]